jgi:aminocarboxymuconate-semialdehyde decarboxylase
MFKPELQIEDMDARGIDVNILTSCDAAQSRAWATFEEEQRMTTLVNEECLRWVATYPSRFMGTMVLPLGDMRMAMEMFEWGQSTGLKVVQLPSNYRGEYLGHSRFADLWAAIEDSGTVAFIHPEGVTDLWYQEYALWNSIGQSIEEVKTMSSLIYEGTLDRYPRLKIVMAHGGGFLPHYMGRLDRNVRERPWTTKNISKKPSEYLTDFYYDSCVYDPRTLEILIERVGIDRIVLGGDYPVADLDPLEFLDSLNITDEDRAKIAGNNASSLLNLR